MESLATALITLAAGTWVGAIIFQSAVVAPAVFADLDAESARRFLRTLFPRYYMAGIVCGFAAMFAALGLALLSEAASVGYPLRLVAYTGMLLVNVYARQSLTPRINAARDAGEAGKATFDRLHRLSVRLNGLVLLVGLAAVSVVAADLAAHRIAPKP